MERHPKLNPVHPGELLAEDILPDTAMSKTEFAAALGISRQTLYDVLNQKQPVTASLTVRLGKLLGNGARFWVSMQRNYDLAVAQREIDVSQIKPLELI